MPDVFVSLHIVELTPSHAKCCYLFSLMQRMRHPGDSVQTQFKYKYNQSLYRVKTLFYISDFQKTQTASSTVSAGGCWFSPWLGYIRDITMVQLYVLTILGVQHYTHLSNAVLHWVSSAGV